MRSPLAAVLVAALALVAFRVTHSSPVESPDAVHLPLRWPWDDSVGPDMLPVGRPLSLAHRGASGMFPEHTRRAYEEAVSQRADIVECDVTLTKDLVLVCSHEPWMSNNSNVNSTEGPPHANFSDRARTYTLNDDDDGFDWNDHGEIFDYFTFDFTFEELTTLRRKQVRDYRDPNFNWQQSFISFGEFLNMSREHGFGIYPEIKLGSATNKILQARNISITLEELIVRELNASGYISAEDPCLVQSFELTSLSKVKELGSGLRRIFLLDSFERTTDQDLDEYRNLGFYGIGLDKNLIFKRGLNGYITENNTDLVQRIHDRRMKVHAYTFRNEFNHLMWDHGQDPYVELEMFLNAGIDGYFSDFPGTLDRFFRVKEMEADLSRGPTFSLRSSSSVSQNNSFLLIAVGIIAFGKKLQKSSLQ